MIQNRLALGAIIGSIGLSALALHAWSGWGGGTTRYNGARTLENRSYEGLEIHGAATLNDVTVNKNLLVTGSTEVSNTTVQGTATIRGALDVKAESSFGTLEIAGSLVAEGITVKGTLTVGRSIDASNSKFAAIKTKRSNNQNETFYFRNSTFDHLYVAGLGTKQVVLNNSTAGTIEFEEEGGVVRLQGTATVTEVINGTIKKK